MKTVKYASAALSIGVALGCGEPPDDLEPLQLGELRAAITTPPISICFTLSLGGGPLVYGDSEGLEDFFAGVSVQLFNTLVALPAGAGGGSAFTSTTGCLEPRSYQTGNSTFTAFGQGSVSSAAFLTTLDSSSRQVVQFSQSVKIPNPPPSRIDVVLNVSPADPILAHNAAAYALRRAPSGGPFHAYQLQVNSGSTFTSGTTVNISADINRSKFTIAHEMGHAVFNTYLPSFTASDLSLNTGFCSLRAGADTTGHGSETLEFSGAALSEGFADYFSALTFNNIAQADCFISRQGKLINCRDGSSGDEVKATAWARTKCAVGGVASCAGGTGCSNEIDWARVFWNMSAPSRIGVADILSWLSSATGFTRENAFFQLDTAANTRGGAVNTRWDVAKATNGVCVAGTACADRGAL